MAQERMIRAQPGLKRFVIAVLFGTMLIRAGLIITDWNFGDINAYWLAAERLKHGEQLYLGSLNPDSYQVFRYAPWFAWFWVPLTYLPRTLVEMGLGGGAGDRLGLDPARARCACGRRRRSAWP